MSLIKNGKIVCLSRWQDMRSRRIEAAVKARKNGWLKVRACGRLHYVKRASSNAESHCLQELCKLSSNNGGET